MSTTWHYRLLRLTFWLCLVTLNAFAAKPYAGTLSWWCFIWCASWLAIPISKILADAMGSKP